MKDALMKKEWDESYERGGNMVFYPHEEIIRFINRYVKKRLDYDRFYKILKVDENNPCEGASLDLGCGIGRHVKFLDEFSLNPYGIDLSETAIKKGKEWLTAIGKEYLAAKIQIGSVTKLPFDDNFFSICVSHGVLDSMPREIAMQGMKEVRRVLVPNGLMYLDLIMSNSEAREGDEIVDDGYEKGTIQSYFTVDSAKKLLADFEIVDFKIITVSDEKGNVKNRRAHVIIKNIK